MTTTCSTYALEHCLPDSPFYGWMSHHCYKYCCLDIKNVPPIPLEGEKEPPKTPPMVPPWDTPPMVAGSRTNQQAPPREPNNPKIVNPPPQHYVRPDPNVPPNLLSTPPKHNNNLPPQNSDNSPLSQPPQNGKLPPVNPNNRPPPLHSDGHVKPPLSNQPHLHAKRADNTHQRPPI